MADPQTDDCEEQTDKLLHPELQKVLDYARVHDLFRKPDTDPIPKLAHSRDLLRRTITITDVDGVTGDGHLTGLTLPKLLSFKDRWSVSNASLAMLQGICRMPCDEELASLAKQLCKLRQAKSLKLELPALLTDNGFDCRQMCANIATVRRVSICEHRFPLEPTDAEKDEGLEIPSAASRAGEMIMQQIEREAIDVPKEAFCYLTEHLKSDLSEEKRWELLSSQLSYKPVSLLLHW